MMMKKFLNLNGSYATNMLIILIPLMKSLRKCLAFRNAAGSDIKEKNLKSILELSKFLLVDYKMLASNLATIMYRLNFIFNFVHDVTFKLKIILKT